MDTGPILHERHAELRERLLHRVAVVDRNGRAGESGQETRQLRGVRVEGQILRPPLEADVDADPVVGERYREAVRAQVAGHIRVHDLLSHRAVRRAGGIES